MPRFFRFRARRGALPSALGPVVRGLALASPLLACGAAFAQLPGGSWELHFADEFNTNALDSMKWNTAYPWGRVHNYPAYIEDRNITVSGGTLNLQAHREQDNGQPYTSGAVNTDGKLNFHLGYIEARMKLPGWLGAWPAFWALQNGWPPELDVMEARFRSDYINGNYNLGYGDMYQYVGTYHWGDGSNPQSAGTGFQYTGTNLTSDFHNYGTLWEPDHVTFYFDGKDMGSVWANPANISQMQNMYLLLNLGVGGWPGNPPDWEQMQAPFQIDWVRVWQHPGAGQTNWTRAGDGNWDDNSAWSASSPQVGSQTAFFGPVTAPSVNVTWTGSRTLGQITFQSAANYTLGNSGAGIMLVNDGGRAFINGYNQSGQGTMTINARLELYNDTSVRNYLNSAITLNGDIFGGGGLSIEDGRAILNGQATYTGSTVVTSNGTFVVNGNIGGTSNFFVQKGLATISAAGKLTSANYSSIGQNAGDTGTLNVFGTFTVNGDLNVADVSAKGQLTLYAPAVVQAQTLYVGKFGTSNGTVIQNGGLVASIPGGGEWRIGGGASAADAGAIGNYFLRAGSINSANNFQVGAYGAGTLTQTGGANTVGGYLSIGRFPSGRGVYDMSSGNGILTATAQAYLVVGEQGAGTFLLGGNSVVNTQSLAVGYSGGTGTVNQTDGTLNAPGGVSLGFAQGGSGTYTLGGGTLIAGGITRGQGTGIFNFNGGTLRATADNATFLQGLTAANIASGGAVIDTNAHAITITQTLTGVGGLTKAGLGALTLAADPTYTGPTAVIGGTLNLGTPSLGALTILDSARAALAPNGARALSVGSLSITGSGQLDLANNGLVVRGGSLASIGAMVASGDNGGTWAGPGIDSSAAAASAGRGAVGYGLASQLLNISGSQAASFMGKTVLPGDVLARFTTLGDANLDGHVDFSDFVILSNHFGQSVADGWDQGDFNGDGVVNFNDFVLLSNNFGSSLTSAQAAIVQQWQSTRQSSVPEPASAALVALAAMGLLARRRP